MAIKNYSIIKKVFFLLIILTAIFFRLWKLESVPPGLYPDEAINGNEALESLKTNTYKVFYPENNGREGLFIWLLSLSFSLFGISIWSLKIIPAVFGIFTVLGVYLLCKELFSSNPSYRVQADEIALLSSFFLAASFWHTNFSRIGFRAILSPFFLVFSLYFLFNGFRNKERYLFLIGGFFFGLGFYTYISFRLSVLLLIIILLLWGVIYKKDRLIKEYLVFTFYFLISVFLIAFPIGIYFLQNPQDFIGRATPISVFTAKNPLKEFLKSFFLHLAMFNLKGDTNWRHNLSGSPQLFLPIGILFLIGTFVSIKHLKKSLKEKNYSLAVIHCSLISWFLIMLLPGMLTVEGIPHALRVICVIPPAYILAGFGTWHTYLWFRQKIKEEKLILILLLFLLFVFIFQSYKYFIWWGKNKETKNAFAKNYVKIGDYLNSLENEVSKIVIVNQSGVPVPWPNGIPMPAQTIMFIENSKYKNIRSVYVLPEEIDKIKINKKPTIIVPMAPDENLFEKLKVMFPTGEVKNKNGVLIFQII